MDEPFDLGRFLDAQEPVLAAVRDELRAGAKRTHWIWFVFPQAAALGRSATARRFGIASRAEAAAYLAHDRLGARLRDCVALFDAHRDRSLHDIFGSPDDLKVRSSLTLFDAVAPAGDETFGAVLFRRCGGPDPATLELLRRPDGDLR